MPYKPKRPCSHPGCPRLTDGRYCEEHEKEAASTYERNQRDPLTSRRYGSAWRKARKKFLAEHPFCKLCRRQEDLHKRRLPITSLPPDMAVPMTMRTSWRYANGATRPSMGARETDGTLKVTTCGVYPRGI